MSYIKTRDVAGAALQDVEEVYINLKEVTHIEREAGSLNFHFSSGNAIRTKGDAKFATANSFLNLFFKYKIDGTIAESERRDD